MGEADMDSLKICPHCGEPVPKGAIRCRHCGSDARTGWSEDAESSLWELPDYDEILENEFGKEKSRRSSKAKAVAVGALAVILSLAFIVGFL